MQWIIPTFPNNLTRDISTVRVIPHAGESAFRTFARRRYWGELAVGNSELAYL